MKKCSKCGETKPRGEFPKNPMGRDGLRSECKPCRNAHTRATYSAKKENRRTISADTTKYIKVDFAEVVEIYRECNTCGNGGHMTELFRKSKNSTRGHTSKCKECNRADNAKYRKKNADRIKAIGTVSSAAKRAVKWAMKDPKDSAVYKNREAVRGAYNSGVTTLSGVAEETGLSWPTINKHATSMGIELETIHTLAKRRRGMIEDYLNENGPVTSATLQKELGVPQATISKFKLAKGLNLTDNTRGSEPEKEMIEFIETVRPDLKVVRSDKTVLKPKHLDAYLPELNLAFEFNGMYCHSDKFKGNKYHQDKTVGCTDKGVRLVHIFGDQWEHKRPICESIIRYALGRPLHKKYARKLKIREVPSSDSMKFQNDNHMLGARGAATHLGLYEGDTLVSLMTFGRSRTDKKHDFELLRFCNALNTSVIGGAERLWSHFKKTHKGSSVICYADASLFAPNLYERLGFELEELTPPCAWYYNRGSITHGIPPRRYHRSGFTRDGIRKKGLMVDEALTVKENMALQNKYLCIHDSGAYKLTYKGTI